jgi:RNA polymerase sigma-70 factor (ECF subfamily)
LVTNHQAELSADEIERLSTGVHIMALRALGDPCAAEEVSQETLVRTIQAIRDGRPRDPGSLGAFVRGIARHVITDTIRASTRERRSSVASGISTGDPAARHPLDALVSEEERARVRSSLMTLSPGDQKLLRLSFYDGLRPREVAQCLGEPAARIRTRKSRALARLRNAFLGSTQITCNESRLSSTE